ncbi:RidA family protein [Hydrogenophaga intermedia]|nr:RidA family protein [Hydrogenophaga intermedia]
MGKDPRTDQYPDDDASQARFMFENLRELLRIGGATLDDVVRVTVFVKNNEQREAINEQWLRCFPDPEDRPARHVQVVDLPGRMLVQLEAIAVMDVPPT